MHQSRRDDLAFVTRAARELRPLAFRLLVVLRCYASRSDRAAWPSHETLRSALGLSHRDKVTRALRELISAGFIEPLDDRRGWRVRDTETVHNGVATKQPPKDNARAVKRLESKHPKIAGQLVKAIGLVRAQYKEAHSANQDAAIRKEVEAWIRKHPASVPVLETSSEPWSVLVARSDWGGKNPNGGTLGYGKRMAHVWRDVVAPSLPTETVEERRRRSENPVSGHNPFV